MNIFISFVLSVKKFILSILSIFYLATSSGATVNLHYCMGEFVGSGIWGESEEDCSKCGMDKEDGGNDCCKDEQKKFSSEQSQQAYQMLQLNVPAIPVNLDFSQHSLTTDYSSLHEAYPVSNAPPRSGKFNTYVINCSFRI